MAVNKKRIAKFALFYASLLALWSLVADLKIWPPYMFPSPWSVLDAMRAGFADHSFWIAIGVSMKRIVIGYGISVAIGMVLGLLLATSDFLTKAAGGLMMSLQSLPSICWLPLAVLWFGLTEKAILFVIVMGSVLSITMAMEHGRHNLPVIYSMAGRNLGARGLQLFFYVLLPASLPHIVAGLKHGWAFAWRSLISGEMIFVSLGLGQLLMMGRDLNDMNLVIAVMLLIIGIGCAVDVLIFRVVERRLQHKWGFALL
jgi:NitT/TauT family transport system permease protein